MSVCVFGIVVAGAVFVIILLGVLRRVKATTPRLDVSCLILAQCAVASINLMDKYMQIVY